MIEVDTDKEIDAMKAAYRAVRDLDEESLCRVLQWIDDRCRADRQKRATVTS